MPKTKKRRSSRKRKYWLALPVALIISLVGAWFLWLKSPSTPLLPKPPLKDLAARHAIQLGNFAILTRLNEKPYNDILSGQFNFVLADNTPNWYFTDGGLRPGPNSYNFKKMDQVVAYARAHNLPIQAHHLVWGEAKWLPVWLKNGNYTPAQLLQLIHDHIFTVAGRYRGQIAQWSVVNEAFTRQQHLFGLHDWWADHIGSQVYIDDAFQWARQADPNATLILNDFDDESPNSVSDAMYNYIKSAKARGVPIDGLGMQMHLDGNHPPQKADVINNMRRFAELGVGIYVTEFDVNMSGVAGSDSHKDQLEANIYYQMMRACIESQVCHSFAFLGITDKESWYNYLGSATADARPLMFDKNYQPKPAFYAMRSALLQP